MSKKNFHRLLSRYRSGLCTEREKHLVERWLSMLGDDVPIRGPQEEAQLLEKLWDTIQLKKERKAAKRFPVLPARRLLVAAASVVLVVFGGIYFLLTYQTEKGITTTRNGSTIVRVNNSSRVEPVVLSDGTEVRLAPHARLECPEHFSKDRRKVYLTGKAFFNVTHDPAKPFFVYAGEIVTKVLGTSFWIDGSRSGKDIEVSVVTGKVAVLKWADPGPAAAPRPKNGVVLTANHKVKFSNKEEIFELGLVEDPVLVVPSGDETAAKESFVFENTPVTEVIEKLENAYGIEIVLENGALNGCLFRGDISQQPLFNKLDLLCSTGNARYEIRGARVLVSGKGCVPDHSDGHPDGKSPGGEPE